MKIKQAFWAHSLLLVLALTACSATEQNTYEPPVRATKFYKVQGANDRFDMSFPAVMKAQQTSALAFTASGFVQDISVIRGQDVRKGQVLARLDNRDFQSNLASARAQFEESETEYQRAKNLLSQNAIAKMTVDQRKAARDVAKATLDRMQKALGDTTIKAPFSGQISAIHVEKFENIQAFQPILTLQNNDSIVATVDIPASVLLHMKQLEPENIRVALEDLPGAGFPAEFLEASSVPNEGSQSYEARFKFTASDNFLVLPGMTGSVQATFIAAEGNRFSAGVEVPISAVHKENGSTFVWLVNTTNLTVSKRHITIEDGVSDKVRVLSGLSIGDTIAAAGVSYMYDGMTVRELQD